MKRQQRLRQRLRTLRTLGDSVLAMKSLAAHQFRMARQSLPAARQYRREVEAAVAAIGVTQPVYAAAPPGRLIVGSDLGLCGDYNSRLAEAATAAWGADPGLVFCVGRRVAQALSRVGTSAVRVVDAPPGVQGVTRSLLDLSEQLLEDMAALRIGSLSVFSARFDGVGVFTPVETQLLPIGGTPSDSPHAESRYASTTTRDAAAIREYLYTLLYEILLDALAAEHGMRLVASESAEHYLEESIDAAHRQLAAIRREATTQEVLDIVAGRR